MLIEGARRVGKTTDSLTSLCYDNNQSIKFIDFIPSYEFI